MDKLGFKPGNADTMVYLQFGNNNSAEIAGWYVDDRLLAAISAKSMN